jgi:predicted Fe-S protein YdhL (DUF1289 family)
MSRSTLRLNAIARGNRALYPASPCVSICSLDDYDVCVGCHRSLDEITYWSSYPKEKQWAIIDDLRKRTGSETLDFSED